MYQYEFAMYSVRYSALFLNILCEYEATLKRLVYERGTELVWCQPPNAASTAEITRAVAARQAPARASALFLAVIDAESAGRGAVLYESMDLARDLVRIRQFFRQLAIGSGPPKSPIQ